MIHLPCGHAYPARYSLVDISNDIRVEPIANPILTAYLNMATKKRKLVHPGEILLHEFMRLKRDQQLVRARQNRVDS